MMNFVIFMQVWLMRIIIDELHNRESCEYAEKRTALRRINYSQVHCIQISSIMHVRTFGRLRCVGIKQFVFGSFCVMIIKILGRSE